MSRKKVLLVDDDADIVEALNLTFESLGYVVKSTTVGKDAYGLVESFHPNVIILDMLLSGIDGRTICRKLKQDQETKDIPIIMISAHPAAARSTLEAGANEFLAKPFDTTMLFQMVEKEA